MVEFGFEAVPYEPIDNPAVVHGVHDSGTHSYEDFQVTPDGRYALFSSVLLADRLREPGPLRALPLRHVVGRRSTARPARRRCSRRRTTSTLTPYGLSLTDDGRVFFTTKDSFVLRDTNGKTDAYEWSSGKTQLISSGLGPDDSALLSVSADGKDAFFFTRDVALPPGRQRQRDQDLRRPRRRRLPVRRLAEAVRRLRRVPRRRDRTAAGAEHQHGDGRRHGSPDEGNGELRIARKQGQEGQPAGRAAAAEGEVRLLGQADKLHKQAKQADKQAKKLEKEAKACKRSSGGGGK